MEYFKSRYTKSINISTNGEDEEIVHKFSSFDWLNGDEDYMDFVIERLGVLEDILEDFGIDNDEELIKALENARRQKNETVK